MSSKWTHPMLFSLVPCQLFHFSHSLTHANKGKSHVSCVHKRGSKSLVGFIRNVSGSGPKIWQIDPVNFFLGRKIKRRGLYMNYDHWLVPILYEMPWVTVRYGLYVPSAWFLFYFCDFDTDLRVIFKKNYGCASSIQVILHHAITGINYIVAIKTHTLH